MIKEDKEHCHKCNEETFWEVSGRNQDYLKCNGCSDQYPCRSVSCGHLDCAEDRT